MTAASVFCASQPPAPMPSAGPIARHVHESIGDELALADHIDPARWPFCEERARMVAGWVAYPDPPMRTYLRKRLSRPDGRSTRHQRERALQQRVVT